MDSIELRKKRIINFIYFSMILGLSYLFFKYCFWMFFPFIFAFFIAAIVQRPANFIVRKTKLKKGITSTFLTLLIYIIIFFIISLIGMKCIDGIKSLISFIKRGIYDLPTFIDNIKAFVINHSGILPDSVEEKFVKSANNWFDMIRNKSASEIASIIVDRAGNKNISFSTFSNSLNGIWNTAKQIPSVFIAIIIAIVSSCFMSVDYDVVVKFIKKQLKPENEEKLSQIKRIVFKSIGNLVRSYSTIILITGVELFIGLNILSVFKIYTGGHIIAISIIVAVLDILPVIGTGTFMIPWSVYSLITDKVSLAIGLFVIYAVIYVVRQIIEPKIVGGSVGLPSFVTLMSMYIGTQLFGFIGLFLLPILIIIIKLLNDEGVIHIWKTGKQEPKKE